MFNNISSFQINESKAVLVAGNGPSLAKIDYNRLPSDLDIFRCNNFYLEEQYFIGKKIKAAFFNRLSFFEQQATMEALKERDEYQCELIVYSEPESALHNIESSQELFTYFPDTLSFFDFYQAKLPELAKYTMKLVTLEGRYMTSGTAAVVTAVAMGYKKIYITGIDLYVGTQDYAFDSKKPNLTNLQPILKDKIPFGDWHSAQTEIAILQKLQELYDIEIYSASPTSPLSEYFPLAFETGFGEQNYHQLCFPKPKDCLKDIIIPQSYAYQQFRNKYYPATTHIPLKHNLIYRLVYDLLHLPSHIKKYLRHKYQSK